MNEHELILGLGAVHQERADVADVQAVRQRVLAAPIQEVPQQRSWLPQIDTGGLDMFSAFKFIAASLIVALFGGFLLTSILTTPQGDEVLPAAATETGSPSVEPSPTEPEAIETTFKLGDRSVRKDILTGVALTVREVEPGVFRVIDDGKKQIKGWAIIAGQDGTIWGIGDGGFLRVGGPSYEWPQHIKYIEQFEVARDGTVWVQSAGPTLDDKETAKKDQPTIRSFDGRTWTFGKRGENLRVVTAPDGTVWAIWAGRGGPVLARWGKDGWQQFDTPLPEDAGEVFITSNGDLWASSCCDYGELHHYADGEWQQLGPPLADVSVGQDGTIWALRQPEVRVVEGGDPGNWADFVTDDEGNWLFDYEDILMRFDGGRWQEWGPADGVPSGLWSLQASPDGSLWAGNGQETCEGMFHFDGTTWDRYLTDLCVASFEVAPDESVWILAGDEPNLDSPDWNDLYVITPEAVAAST